MGVENIYSPSCGGVSKKEDDVRGQGSTSAKRTHGAHSDRKGKVKVAGLPHQETEDRLPPPQQQQCRNRCVSITVPLNH